MTERVVSVRPATPIARVQDLLTANRFSALPVTDERHRLVGIVTTVDLLRARLAPASAGARTAGDIMSRDVICLSPSSGVGVLAHRLRTYGELRVMPIVERRMLVGVVSRGDLLRRDRKENPLSRLVQRLRALFRPGEPPPPPVLFTAAPPAVPASQGNGHAEDVMTTSGLVTVTPSTSVALAAELLTEQRFTALPVVDEADHLLGIVSEADLIHDPLDGRRSGRPRTVGEAMTRDVVALSNDAPIRELYGLLAERGFRLVPILRAGRLVGVVSRGDLLRRTSGVPE
jgi:CBS domain-containing protein